MAVASQNGRSSAKMAGWAPHLPKWQPEQISCQMPCQIGIANIMPKNNLFSSNFFRLQLSITNISSRKRKGDKMKMNEMYLAGTWFAGTRKDGRFFKGKIEKVADHAKGTLIVLKIGEKEYKSVYAEDIVFSDCRSYAF